MSAMSFAGLLCPHFDATIEHLEIVEYIDADGGGWSVRLRLRPHGRGARVREAAETGETRELAMVTMVDKAPLWAQVHGMVPR